MMDSVTGNPPESSRQKQHQNQRTRSRDFFNYTSLSSQQSLLQSHSVGYSCAPHPW